MNQQRAQDGQILRYFIARNAQIGGNYKNFHHALVALWGNYKVLGSKYTPLRTIRNARLYGILSVQCGGWQLEGNRYFIRLQGFRYKSVISDSELFASVWAQCVECHPLVSSAFFPCSPSVPI